MGAIGLTMLVIAAVLLAADLALPGAGPGYLGVLALAGGGVLVLAAPGATPPWLIPAVAVGVAAFTGGQVWTFRQVKRMRLDGEADALVGAAGVARGPLAPSGRVVVKGERWDAIAERGSIANGERVRVVGVEAGRLRVRREEAPSAGGPN